MDWSKINSWLESLYNKKVPTFEHSEKNYEVLDYLRIQHYDSIPLINYILMNKVEFQLSKESQRHVDTLAHLAVTLGMGTTQLHNYYSAISKLSTDQLEYQQELAKLTDIENSIDANVSESTYELDIIQNILNELEKNHSNERDTENIHETRIQEQKKIDEIFKQESHNYIQLKERYTDIEKKGIKIEQLIQLTEKIYALEQTTETKKAQLMEFHGLPSDMVLASLKHKETQAELRELEQERENLISDIANSVY